MKKWAQRLIVDDRGQDLIEYALLASFIGFAATAGVMFLGDKMKLTYLRWNTQVQDLADP